MPYEMNPVEMLELQRLLRAMGFTPSPMLPRPPTRRPEPPKAKTEMRAAKPGGFVPMRDETAAETARRAAVNFGTLLPEMAAGTWEYLVYPVFGTDNAAALREQIARVTSPGLGVTPQGFLQENVPEAARSLALSAPAMAQFLSDLRSRKLAMPRFETFSLQNLDRPRDSAEACSLMKKNQSTLQIPPAGLLDRRHWAQLGGAP